MSSPIPVIVLSGGLGSGKTTLLNHLLRCGVGRVGVIINDFGDINVDAFLVTGHVDATMAITGGCLCCLSDTDELDTALAALAAPALDLDVVLVEASGLAEPRELARMVLSSQVAGIRFGGVLEIVDCAAWAQSPDAVLPVGEDHVRVASLLVLNKVDRVRLDRMRALRQRLRELAPQVPAVWATFGQVDPALLYDAAERGQPTGQLSLVDLPRDEHAHDEHHHHPHTSVSLNSEQPCDPDRLVHFLESRPAGLYRVKGETYVNVTGGPRRYVVQAVGGWLSFERAAWPDGQRPRTRLVAIGAELDRAALEDELRRCLGDGRELSAPQLHAVTRYVRS